MHNFYLLLFCFNTITCPFRITNMYDYLSFNLYVAFKNFSSNITCSVNEIIYFCCKINVIKKNKLKKIQKLFN